MKLEHINEALGEIEDGMNHIATCHRCDGGGWVSIFGQSDLQKQPSPECDGTGYIVNKETNDQRAKSDEGKLEIDLVPMQIVKDIAEVRMYGNKKYSDPNNWKKVELRRYVNALLRHTLAFVECYDRKDEESNIEHYKHMACNMAFICEMMKLRLADKQN